MTNLSLRLLCLINHSLSR